MQLCIRGLKWYQKWTKTQLELEGLFFYVLWRMGPWDDGKKIPPWVSPWMIQATGNVQNHTMIILRNFSTRPKNDTETFQFGVESGFTLFHTISFFLFVIFTPYVFPALYIIDLICSICPITCISGESFPPIFDKHHFCSEISGGFTLARVVGSSLAHRPVDGHVGQSPVDVGWRGGSQPM